MIKTSELIKIFRTDEIETTALDRVSIEVKEGEFVAIMGPSGCGKSTLLNILGMLDRCSSGSYQFMNEEVSSLPEKSRANLRKQNLGYIFQNFNLIEDLSVFENIELPLLYLGIGSQERKKRVIEVMEQMNIAHRRNHFPLQLSGGQQQRVAVARAVVVKPRLILADEPTGNLDSAHGEEVMELLDQLNKAGTTIIMVTHSLRDAEYSQRILRLFDGQIINENINRKFAL
ncbi:MAG: ABC transporter ATP-binding protein [Bacteroidales bacterium]|jgi:putative ABC transport system ATP-binding protein|nr:ABC transporter ATP-binding protein [Bacteroidales bacterium]